MLSAAGTYVSVAAITLYCHLVGTVSMVGNWIKVGKVSVAIFVVPIAEPGTGFE